MSYSLSLMALLSAAPVLAHSAQPIAMPNIFPITGPHPPRVSALAHQNPHPWAAPNMEGLEPGKFWHGWSGVEKMFVFGDSYSTTGFNCTMSQPSADMPLGNPAFPGYTSSNGPNWVDYLTMTYNQSMIETYNLAYGGAVVDQDLVAEFLPTVLDFRQQVNTEFVPYYVNGTAADYSSDGTLFAAFFGINDVGNSYAGRNTTLNALIFDVYMGLLDELYQAGARNFLLLNVPPVHVAPLTTAQGPPAMALEAADIADWNDRVAQMAARLQYTYAETTVFQFDTNRVFTQVLIDPASYPQTSGYTNTTGYCAAYENGTPTQDYLDASCGVPVNQYFWLNTLHPTYPMHDVLGASIAYQLEAGQFMS